MVRLKTTTPVRIATIASPPWQWSWPPLSGPGPRAGQLRRADPPGSLLWVRVGQRRRGEDDLPQAGTPLAHVPNA